MVYLRSSFNAAFSIAPSDIVAAYNLIYALVDPILCRVVSLEKNGIKLKWHKIVFMPVRHIIGGPFVQRFGIKFDKHTKRKSALRNTR